MATILVAFSTQDEGFELIPAGHKIIRPPHGRDFTHEELIEFLPEADVLCTSFDYQAPSALLAHGEHLRLIILIQLSLENIVSASPIRPSLSSCRRLSWLSA